MLNRPWDCDGLVSLKNIGIDVLDTLWKSPCSRTIIDFLLSKHITLNSFENDQRRIKIVWFIFKDEWKIKKPKLENKLFYHLFSYFDYFGYCKLWKIINQLKIVLTSSSLDVISPHKNYDIWTAIFPVFGVIWLAFSR